MKTPYNICVLEDDPSCIFVYEEILSVRYELVMHRTLKDFQSYLADNVQPRPDLIIADLRLQDGSFLRFLSGGDSRDVLAYPFIVVSSIDDLDVLRLCFSEGALDYLTKPFRPNELLVKVENLLKSCKEQKKTDGELRIDPTYRTITRNAVSADLTPKQLQILTALQNTPDRTMSREQLASSLWKNEVNVGSRTLDVHLYNLRRKVRAIGLDIVHRPPDHYMLVPLVKKTDAP